MLELFLSVRQWLDRCDSNPQGSSMTSKENLENFIFEVILDMNLTLDVCQEEGNQRGWTLLSRVRDKPGTFSPAKPVPPIIVQLNCYPNVPLRQFQVRCQEERRRRNNENEILLVTHVTTGWYQKHLKSLHHNCILPHFW